MVLTKESLGLPVTGTMLQARALYANKKNKGRR